MSPIFDHFVVVQAELPRPVPGDRCRVVGRAIVRKDAATDSPKVGELEKNELVLAEDFRMVTDKSGQQKQQRIKVDRGWTSLLSKKGAWLLMKDHADVDRKVVHHHAFQTLDAAQPQMIEHFCIPTSNELICPQARSTYSFIRTLEGGARQYGNCIRVRTTRDVSADADTVAVLCLLSQHPWFTIFSRVLEVLEKQWQSDIGDGDFAKLDAIVTAVSIAASASLFPEPGDIIHVTLPENVVDGGTVLRLERPDDKRDPCVDIQRDTLFHTLSVSFLSETTCAAVIAEQA